MAIFIPGMVCSLCGRLLERIDELELFPPFMPNELDPTRVFHDGAFHARCVTAHPYGQRARAVIAELISRGPASEQQCTVTRTSIVRFEDYFNTGIIVSDPSDPLYAFNLLPFDKHALKEWSGLRALETLLEVGISKGRLGGKGIEWLLTAFRRARSG
jgi:hypothetical protein